MVCDFPTGTKWSGSVQVFKKSFLSNPSEICPVGNSRNGPDQIILQRFIILSTEPKVPNRINNGPVVRSSMDNQPDLFTQVIRSEPNKLLIYARLNIIHREHLISKWSLPIYQMILILFAFKKFLTNRLGQFWINLYQKQDTIIFYTIHTINLSRNAHFYIQKLLLECPHTGEILN